MTATQELEHTQTDEGTEESAHRRLGWRRWIVPALIVLAALVALGVWWQVLDQRSQTNRVEQARAAAETIVMDLLTYGHESVAEDLDAALADVTGTFAEDYQQLVDEAIVPISRERQIDTEAVVVQSGIVASDADSVTVLLFVDQSTTSSDAPGTRRDLSRIEVTASEIDGVWKINRLEAV